MPQCADLLVRRRDGAPIMQVEVKNRERLSENDATELRKTILQHCAHIYTPYFLLASQDTGYLWTNSEAQQLDAPPRYEFELNRIISRYLPTLKDKERLRHPELQLLLFQWLIDLASRPISSSEEPEKTLDESGLLDAVKGASVRMEDDVC